MNSEQKKDLRRQLLSVMNIPVRGKNKVCDYSLRETVLYALGAEWNLTPEDTRQEMLYIRKAYGNI